ncbi:hypothetical protein BON65_05910 [Escherichia coli]|nr:hypothetical protein AKG99_07650 [Escherichia coli]OIJ01130.1 hypothetical protein BHF03_21245 [Escherichia coli]OWC39032.1 hypothetical protein A8F96_15775 [Escherichia coli]PGG52910.1 hypothetical protein BMR14_05170 [Escherichia coli]POS24173.1 hypothetical protein BJN43_08515 [Escherichia coli]
MQQYIHLYLTIKHHFSDISFYWKDDRVMTEMKKAVCFQQDSHQASGICAQMPYPPKNIKPAIMRFRDNRSRPSLPAAQKNNRRR